MKKRTREVYDEAMSFAYDLGLEAITEKREAVSEFISKDIGWNEIVWVLGAEQAIEEALRAYDDRMSGTYDNED